MARTTRSGRVSLTGEEINEINNVKSTRSTRASSRTEKSKDSPKSKSSKKTSSRKNIKKKSQKNESDSEDSEDEESPNENEKEDDEDDKSKIEEVNDDEDENVENGEEEESSEKEEIEELNDADEEELMMKKKLYLLDQEVKQERLKHRDETVRRFKYLLTLSNLFRDFIDTKIKKDLYLKKVITEYEKNIGMNNKKSKSKKRSTNRRRKTEKEEDLELLHDEEDENTEDTLMTESPSFIQGKLRDYQIQGLNWLISLHENCLSGILADEMGLGKTLQTISFLGYLRYVKNIKGPHIVIVPKSTLDNWRREFAKWTPDVKVLLFSGNKDERHDLIQNNLLACDFDVVVTSFETVIREKGQLKKFRWQYIIVDEAHRIKNEESSLSQIIRLFYSSNRLLITGTPLQNNLHELWALLNFLLPDVFGDSEVFDQWFATNEEGDDEKREEEDSKMIDKLHQILSPFLLRRVKNDVEKSLLPKKELNLYVGMSKMQIEWYKRLLEKDIDAVNGAVGKREGKTRLLNIVMQLRKCCNHPYLFEGAEPGPPYTTDEHLIYNSGKLLILDKLLKKFQKDGSRVLIFSQMSRLLDILEDYCYFRQYEYCRIDGSTAHEDRIEAIDEYNKPNSSKFVFLLTTRAGGLGINLTTANVVILYDSDWNPQADLQAMDRAHRIGQKKQVRVYRFVTENAIEEKVLERATQKLRLDQLVIQQGRVTNSANNSGMAKNKVGDSKDDLLSMIQHGAKEVFEGKNDTMETVTENIEDILAKSEAKTAKLNEKFSKLGLDDLQKFTSDSSAYEWNGENFSKKANEKDKTFWINPSKRERKEQTYSVDGYYKDMLQSTKLPNGKIPKQPKNLNMLDHQFYPEELNELIEKENLYYKRSIGYTVRLSEIKLDEDADVKVDKKVEEVSESDSDDEFLASDSDDEKEEIKNEKPDLKKLRESKRRQEQQRIKKAEPLTEEEEELKKKLINQAFGNWTRRDFTNFIHAAAKFGRDDYKQIAKELGNKTKEEVAEYSKSFWENYEKIEGYQKYISQITAGEKKFQKINLQKDLLNRKVSLYVAPLQQLQIQYPPNNSKRIYTELEDRYLLVMVNKFGLTSENLYEKVKESILDSDLFKFDWFFRSRTTQELGRRTNTLLLALTREFEGPNALKRKREKKVNKDESNGNEKKIKV